MANPDLGFGDYLKEAFKWKPAMPLLGRLPLNWLGLGGFLVAGLFNPGFWFLGAALEVAYLMGMSSAKRFQKLVHGQRLLAQRETFEQRLERTYKQLAPPAQARYRRLWDSCKRAIGISQVLENDFTGLNDQRMTGLSQLLAIFLRLLTSRELMQDTLQRADIRQVEAEVAKVEQRLAKEPADSPLHRSLQGTHEIQKKRLENFQRAEQSLALIEAELERIEQHVVLIGEEAAMTGRTEALTDRLDSVTSALSETNRWLEQNAEIFGDIETDPILSPTPAALPRAPMTEQPQGGNRAGPLGPTVGM
jgi:hypothetical protein